MWLERFMNKMREKRNIEKSIINPVESTQGENIKTALDVSGSLCNHKYRMQCSRKFDKIAMANVNFV